MKLVYLVKIKYKDGSIISLFSPDLKVDFIARYIEFVNELSSLPAEKLKTESLQRVMETYVEWIQDNNYVLRLPDHSQIDLFHQGEQWINVQLDTSIKKGTFEQLGKIAGVSIFLTTFVLGEFFFILAARLNKVSYTTLILPMILDFTMSGIIYTYSGAASNIVDKGKKLDDILCHKKISPIEEADFVQKQPFCSIHSLSKFILCILPMANTIFQSFGYFQSMMSMRNQFISSNIDDPIITPKFIFYLAIVTTVIDAIYEMVMLTSFTFKATNVLETFLNKNYNAYSKCIKHISEKHYSKVLTDEAQAESEIDDDHPSAIAPSSFSIITQAENRIEQDIAMFFITDFVYNNLLLNKQDFLSEVKRIGGAEAVRSVINLGENYEVAGTIIEYIEQYGIKHVAKILFSDITKSYKVEIDLSCDQIVAIAEDEAAKKCSKTFVISDIEKIASEVIEQNFFLNNAKGRELIETVASNVDEQTLLTILEFGRDPDIAEQILSEIEAQGTNRVVYILLGKEVPIADTTNNLENILSKEELNQLRLLPNGIFNAWSNKAYTKIVEYIDNLAKNLDNLLNTGRSGSQVAVTLALLEEWLGFAASDQRFIGGRPPYYNPDNNDDWSYGDSGSSGGNNNSSAGNFDSQNEFVGLMLPVYNSTDYNDSNHQM